MTRRSETTPLNDQLIEWSNLPKNQPPQAWFDETDDLFATEVKPMSRRSETILWMLVVGLLAAFGIGYGVLQLVGVIE